MLKLENANKGTTNLRKELSSFFVSNFFCKKDQDVQNFLHKNAIRFEDADKSRTYLIVDEAELSNQRLVILGYFSLELKSIDLAEEISKSKRRELDGISKDAKSLNVYLIGQLAKNDLYIDKITGSEIIDYAIPLIKDCMKKIGGRVVLVECKNKKKLLEFYHRHNFKVLQSTPDSEDMIQLIKIIK